MKPSIKSELCQREISFYETLSSNYLDCINFRSFIPKYYGCLISHDNEDNRDDNNIIEEKKFSAKTTYLMLENLSKQFKYPNIIDIKIGRKTYEPSASIKKIEHEISKYPMQDHFGYRISGMKVYNKIASYYKHYNKDFCHNIDPESLLYCFGIFLFDGLKFQKEILKLIIERLNTLLDCFHNEKIYHHFYSSSLLIIYDSDHCNQGNDISGIVNVYMIDFAHVIDSNMELDMNYIHGLKNILKILNDIYVIMEKDDESLMQLKSSVIERFNL